MAKITSASLSPKKQNVSFIAWLCSRFNMPASPLSGIAADFINNLLGVNVPFQKVDVQTKIYGIDVLLTLRNVDGKDYYVVIEVVTDKRLKSKEEANYPYANYLAKHPLGTGIDTLIQTMHVSEDRVFAVYYKTGHVADTPCDVIFDTTNKRYIYYSRILSEKAEVLKYKIYFRTGKPIKGVKICDIDEIYKFFNASPSVHANLSSDADLSEYVSYINKLHAPYHLRLFAANHLIKDPIWLKIFDEFCKGYKNNHPNSKLTFTLKFTGFYWEIYVIADRQNHVSNDLIDFPWPILNIRSTMFAEKHPHNGHPHVYLLNTDKKMRKNGTYYQQIRYCLLPPIIPPITHGIANGTSLQNANGVVAGCGGFTCAQKKLIDLITKFRSDEIIVEDIIDLLTIICESFEVYAANDSQGAFHI